MRRLISSACVGLLSATALLAAAAPASASTITTTLPASLTATGPIEVPFEVATPSGVCDIDGSGATVTGSGPYVLRVDGYAVRHVGTNTVRVYVDSCDGDFEMFEVQVVVPLVADVSPVVAPWSDNAYDGLLRVTAEGTPADPLTLTVMRNGSPVHSWGPISDAQELEYKISRKDAKGSWQVVTTTASGTSVTTPFEVALRWAPMTDRLLTYPRCSTVKWSIDRSGAPKGVAGIEKDIEAALDELAAATGLRFAKVDAEQGPTLTFEFKAMGRNGVGGLGGYHWSSDGTYTGSVELNSQHWWLKRPGFGYTRGTPNRGHLLLHEVAHTMGLGHVADRSQVMNPIALSGSPGHLSKGDLAGLKFLYAPQTCG